jgi:hypothetical protein
MCYVLGHAASSNVLKLGSAAIGMGKKRPKMVRPVIKFSHFRTFLLPAAKSLILIPSHHYLALCSKMLAAICEEDAFNGRFVQWASIQCNQQKDKRITSARSRRFFARAKSGLGGGQGSHDQVYSQLS